MSERLDEQLLFSGYEWLVKRSDEPVGPGPNRFGPLDRNVRLDDEGHLHLLINQEHDVWRCAEVVLTHPFGYGRYEWHLAGGAEAIDEHAVLGLFTWSTRPEFHNREIDIEIARWSRPENENTQYVVQPYDRPGNIRRFAFDLQGRDSTHSFTWLRDEIAFRSLAGAPDLDPDAGAVLQSWVYRGPDIPPAGHAHTRINLWLFQGRPPANGHDVEVVMNRFEYVPEEDLGGEGTREAV